ncbi:MAG: hypothetical protein COA70_04640 [Planctomycetota bacterium]|nr:MAG: hypothetical protein COA70_04640 [Planctomycetota bacterium]
MLTPEEALEPYAPEAGHGPWTATQVGHLLSRAIGGAKPGQIKELLKVGSAKALDFVFEPDQEMLEAAWMGIGEPLSVNDDRSKLAAWWMMKMVQDDRVTGTRLALFWHSHFATTWSKVADSEKMYRQHLLFLEKGSGSFQDLLLAIAKDPAILVFLDNDSNRKGIPNENLARELMELFALGEGHYSERDVQEAARALTGRTVDKGRYRFVELHHDDKAKTVLNTTLHDGDDLVRTLVAEDECPKFLARKLWAFYVAPEIDDDVLDLLATRWRENYLDINWLLQTILGSRAFYEPEALGSLVKSPVDFVIGAMRALGGRPDPRELERSIADMGQALFEPPGVQGWKGGEAWIHTASWIERTRFAADVSAGHRDMLRKSPMANLFPMNRRRLARTALDDLLRALIPAGLTAERHRALLVTLDNLPTDNDSRRFQSMVYTVLCLPEYHMS